MPWIGRRAICQAERTPGMASQHPRMAQPLERAARPRRATCGVSRATWGLCQTLSADKTGRTVRQHALATWEILGLPDGLRLDDDTAFCGGQRAPRRLGAFVRLCLYAGIEPIFIPIHEPEFNGAVEFINGLWSAGFWNRYHLRYLSDVQHAQAHFLDGYNHDFLPPALAQHTVAESTAQVQRVHLTAEQVAALPDNQALPITTGHSCAASMITATSPSSKKAGISTHAGLDNMRWPRSLLGLRPFRSLSFTVTHPYYAWSSTLTMPSVSRSSPCSPSFGVLMRTSTSARCGESGQLVVLVDNQHLWLDSTHLIAVLTASMPMTIAPARCSTRRRAYVDGSVNPRLQS